MSKLNKVLLLCFITLTVTFAAEVLTINIMYDIGFNTIFQKKSETVNWDISDFNAVNYTVDKNHLISTTDDGMLILKQEVNTRVTNLIVKFKEPV